MNIPPSDKFTPVNLSACFNADRIDLDDRLKLLLSGDDYFGDQAFQGVPFALGSAGQANVVLLDKDEITLQVNQKTTYVLFLHIVEQRTPRNLDGLPDFGGDGIELGDAVSDYILEYDDGTRTITPILRRFAIQQSRVGPSPFAAVPNFKHTLGGTYWGTASGRDANPEKLWIYALPNPAPDKVIERIVCRPRDERAVIYGVTCTLLEDHPLRPGIREKLRLELPEGTQLGGRDPGELEEVDIDLGQVISARAVPEYDRDAWMGDGLNVQPIPSKTAVVIEYTAHPQARLYVGTEDGAQRMHELSAPDASITIIEPAWRPVRLRTVDKESGQPVAVRLHLHGQEGEFLPPKGYHRVIVRQGYGEFYDALNQHCHIPGECVADLPLGEVFVDISRGYEVAPIRTSVHITEDTDELTFELERVLDWRQNGWVTADTHVHFIQPITARLEGEAEGVNVVNLLASQWGERFSNVGDFDGRTTIGAREFGGDGEFLVRVGSENRMQVLGHISLLGYSGPLIQPLCTGGPSESALGDPLEVTMAQWAQQCIDQNGLVVMPHAPGGIEHSADVVLGLIHAIEMKSFNPHDHQIDAAGIADWYRYLNLGYHIPVVGGSDKMSTASLLGGMRTYAHLATDEFSYENWMRAVRRGNTFVTVGPLIDFKVEGLVPGNILELPNGGGTINATWEVESVRLPVDQVEVVVGGMVADQVSFDKTLTAKGSCELTISASSWVALRVRGSYRRQQGEIAAHSSAVQIRVGGSELFSQPDATAVLAEIEGAMAYVDTLAPRPEATRYKQLRVALKAAHRRMHQRLHQQGKFHEHALHSPEDRREH